MAGPSTARALLTFTDHTQALRSRSELASVERRMRAVLDGAPIVLFAVDRRGVFTVSEGQGLASLGLKPGEVVGRSAFELYRDNPEIVAALRSALAGNATTSTASGGGSALRDQLLADPGGR